ncbi:MAG: hypothetical protein FWD92_04320, partial [Methanomassiliicoccaceae archaeon]|nr:hypothetical protein [Methanomassiliicoccaceae archaeon]
MRNRRAGGKEMRTEKKKEERRAGRKDSPVFDLMRTVIKPKAMISMFAALILLTASLSMITGENGNDRGEYFDPDTIGATVRVTDITNVPTSALAGMPLTLTGTVLPINATSQTITWSIKDAGTTGASLSGNVLTAPNTGTLTVTASIEEKVSEFIMVSVDETHAVVIKSDGTLWTWGLNEYGQLGDGTTINRSSPAQIGSDTWKYVSAGEVNTAAIRSDGTLWAWGNNSNGQLGDGTTISRSSPVQIGSDKWISVSAGWGVTMAIKEDGTLWAWGNNGGGRLGLGDTTQRNSPDQIGTDTWKSVSAGAYHTVAIKEDGTLWAWGNNQYGKLGDGTTESRNAPAKIGSDKWISVSAGWDHTVGIKEDGTLWAWGRNIGLLGIDDSGSGTSVSSPVQVGTATDWASVSAGSHYTMALKSDGTLWVWGSNYNGQLGDGTNTDILSPTQMGSDKWTSTSNGWYSTMAIKEDGTLWVWGWNGYGQLGLGDTTDRNAPTLLQVPWTAYFIKDFTISVMDRNCQYEITGSGSSFTAIGYLSDGVSTYTVSGASNTSIQNVINAIRTDANGRACSIEFKGTPLNIGANGIEFNNTGGTWGTITLKGA